MHNAYIMWGDGRLRKEMRSQAVKSYRLSWGRVRALRTIFLTHHRIIDVCPYTTIAETVICRRSGWPGTFFRLFSWLSGNAVFTYWAGPLPTHRHALVFPVVLMALKKSPEWLREQSSFLLQVRKQVAVSCLRMGVLKKIKCNSNIFLKQWI